MPDITMCYGTDCPKAKECYRCTATPDKQRQAWFLITPYNEENGECLYFWGQNDSCQTVSDR